MYDIYIMRIAAENWVLLLAVGSIMATLAGWYACDLVGTVRWPRGRDSFGFGLASQTWKQAGVTRFLLSYGLLAAGLVISLCGVIADALLTF